MNLAPLRHTSSLIRSIDTHISGLGPSPLNYREFYRSRKLSLIGALINYYYVVVGLIFLPLSIQGTCPLHNDYYTTATPRRLSKGENQWRYGVGKIYMQFDQFETY